MCHIDLYGSSLDIGKLRSPQLEQWAKNGKCYLKSFFSTEASFSYYALLFRNTTAFQGQFILRGIDNAEENNNRPQKLR